MRHLLRLILISFLFINIQCVEEKDERNLPLPTETHVKWDMEEGDKKSARRDWIELLHQSDTNTYWRNIENKRALTQHEQKSYSIQQLQGTPTSTYIQIAGDSLIGFWDEKGSKNQAGSVIATTYDSEADEIYLVSAGGSLFKGSRQGNQWEVINQSVRFSGDLLDFIETKDGKRLIGFVEGIPAWSDDKGKTWSYVKDWMTYTDGWGGIYHPVISRDSQTIVTLAKPSYWSTLSLWYSEDGGETYSKIRDLDSHDPNLYELTTVHHSNEILFTDKVNSDVIDLYVFDEQSNEFTLSIFIDEQGFGEDGKANMVSTKVNDSIVWHYFYDENKDLYYSDDNGETWTYQSTLPVNPWGVGLYVLPSDPEFLLLGAVECWKSGDRGKSWTRQNSWGEYYNNVESKLHADMMYFREFNIPSENKPFIAISNHGGLNLSYDKMRTVDNIGLSGLNVSQYYSVKTDPLDVSYIYAGSQDQGFQRGYNGDFGPANFTQTISGDYGHIVFSNNGKHLWSVYPGGWVIYYENPVTGSYPTLSYTLESEDETVWLPPLAESAYPNRNEIFMAGGNIEGGKGSYLIRLDAEDGEIKASQYDFDFLTASEGGKISAIHNSKANPDKIYVATTNGKAFYSENRGFDWTESLVQAPGAHYLYGASILASEKNPSFVFIGGSGYSTPPVIFSFNGGNTFIPFDKGLPPTTVFGLAMDETEELLFAATEAGPFVCFIDSRQWYPIGGNIAPNQTYWSVDFIENENVARFGTYGRGIWDFYIENINSLEPANHQEVWTVYPNPAIDMIYVEGEKRMPETYLEIYDLKGRSLVTNPILGDRTKLDISTLSSGIYLISIRSQKGIIETKKIVKQ